MTDPGPLTILYTGTTPPRGTWPGAQVIHLPMLTVRPIDFDLEALRSGFDRATTFVFYSQHSARIVCDSGLFDGTDLSAHAFWAVGQKTAAWLEQRLMVPVSFPPGERFATLTQALEKATIPGKIIAFSLADKARDLGPVADAQGVAFEDVPVYETSLHPDRESRGALAVRDVHWIAFTSPRGVDALVDAVDRENLKARRLAAIGPTTADALLTRGLTPDLISTTPDRNGLIEAILNFEA